MRALAAALLLAILLYVAAFEEGPLPLPPGSAAIDRLERDLADHPCVGALARWERHYSFKAEPLLQDFVGSVSIFGMPANHAIRWYDYRKIDIDLVRAGRKAKPQLGLEATQSRRLRHAIKPSQGFIVDRTGWPTLLGTYDLETRQLAMWDACGS